MKARAILPMLTASLFANILAVSLLALGCIPPDPPTTTPTKNGEGKDKKEDAIKGSKVDLVGNGKMEEARKREEEARANASQTA